MTHRGPFQLLPFCDSVNSALKTRTNILVLSKHMHRLRHSAQFSGFRTLDKILFFRREKKKQKTSAAPQRQIALQLTEFQKY